MKDKKIHGRTTFMAALFIASAFVLGLKLLNPTPIQIVIEGQSVSINQLPGFFTLEDVIIVAIASITLGVSGTYLLFFDLVRRSAGELVLEERKRRWREIAKILKEDERKVYQAIIEAGGIIEQSKLPEKRDFLKRALAELWICLRAKGWLRGKGEG